MADGLTPQEAAKLCKYKERQIRNACAAKRIEGADQIGGTWYFSREAFHKWLDTPEYHRTGKKVSK